MLCGLTSFGRTQVVTQEAATQAETFTLGSGLTPSNQGEPTTPWWIPAQSAFFQFDRVLGRDERFRWNAHGTAPNRIPSGVLLVAAFRFEVQSIARLHVW